MERKRARRTPRQERSRQLRSDLLTAALRVLRTEGPLRLTTTRVAEVAGVSIGSLYQYFPDKRALVRALHEERVQSAWIEVQRTLDDPALGSREQIRRIARLFFLSEAEDLGRMGPLLDEEEPHALDLEIARRFARFVRESLPVEIPEEEIRFRTELLMTVIEGVGRQIARRGLAPEALERWAEATGDLLADGLKEPTTG